ncbi:MAG TPA: methyltransferase domain-containing protein [archaeon]|nr:methyltransferase domain-containing protein [archaeon]
MNQIDIWNKIASGWSDFRQKPMKEVIDFSKKKDGKILDVGCGNCRNLKPFKNCELYGIDFSESMIKEAEKYCKKHGMDVKLKRADAAKIPFEDNFFDAALCMALLHHLKEGERQECLSEIFRVLKKGGEILFSVWHKKEKGMKFIPWKKGKEELMRYYYFYDKDELKSLIEEAGFVLNKEWISKNKESNIFVLAKKPL